VRTLRTLATLGILAVGLAACNAQTGVAGTGLLPDAHARTMDNGSGGPVAHPLDNGSGGPVAHGAKSRGFHHADNGSGGPVGHPAGDNGSGGPVG
jgi:hypothetical protein